MTYPALQLDHVALPAFDPVATRAFYRDVLGFSLVDTLAGDDWGGRAWLMMIFATPAGHQLALCAFGKSNHGLDADWPEDARHYAFAVADARAQSEWKTRLDAHGVAWREEDHGAQRSIYFKDPSGTVLEITAPPTPSRAMPSSNAAHDAVIDAWVRGHALSEEP